MLCKGFESSRRNSDEMYRTEDKMNDVTSAPIAVAPEPIRSPKRQEKLDRDAKREPQDEKSDKRKVQATEIEVAKSAKPSKLKTPTEKKSPSRGGTPSR